MINEMIIEMRFEYTKIMWLGSVLSFAQIKRVELGWNKAKSEVVKSIGPKKKCVIFSIHETKDSNASSMYTVIITEKARHKLAVKRAIDPRVNQNTIIVFVHLWKTSYPESRGHSFSPSNHSINIA